MDEISTQGTPEVSADLNDLDVSDIDFGDITAEEDTTTEETKTEEETAPETDTADQQGAAEGEAHKEKTDVEEQPKETDQFTLKHLDEVKTVSREEVISLAQKGMDYDRQKQKAEERYSALEAENQKSEERLALFDEIAKINGYGNIDELAENILAEQVAERDGVDKAAALKQIKLDKREKELAAREQSISSEKDAKLKFDDEAKAFIEKFPDVDAKTIPPEVWEKVNSGRSLADAYGDYVSEQSKRELAEENARLKAELEAAKKNADNKAKSTGSVTSAGKETTKDPWLSDLESRL